MKPKQWYESRTNKLHIASAVTAVVAGFFAAFAPGKVSVETAGAIASLLIFAARGAWLKADDRAKEAARRSTATVGEIVAAKPTGKVSP